MSIRPLSVFLAAPLAGALACSPKGDSAAPTVGVGEELKTQWALQDVNATSPTFEQVVSPADLIGQVSVWYFGHST